MAKKKYRALRVIAFLFQVLAWVSLILAVLGAAGAVLAGLLNMVSIPALEGLNRGNAMTLAGIVGGVITGVVVILVGIINFIFLLAVGEYIYVQLDIEQNTRQTSESLRVLLQVQQAAIAPAVAMAAMSAPPAPVEPYPPEPTITTATPTPTEVK